MKKVFLMALAALLLSSAGMRRAAQGQPSSTMLSGSWIGTVTLPTGINPSGDTATFLLTYNPNGTVILVNRIGRGGDEVAVGTWASTGDGQFSQTTINFHHGSYDGSDKLRVSFSVSGSQMNGNAEIVFYDQTGAAQGTLGGITFSAKPIAVEAIGSM
jgi:hypothetical protein